MSNHGRRRFLGKVAMTIAAGHLGLIAATEANDREPLELGALGRAAEWLNSPRLTASGMAGKVVLVDFCTYTCINWLRTLPYVRAWAQKYRARARRDRGAHTRVRIRKDLDNVRRALQQLRIDYPIAVDNDYSIWRAFSNNYWPALYFIDARGRVREHHFGEGEYERSEGPFSDCWRRQASGGVADGVVSVEGDGVEAAADWGNLKSPENYLGQDRAQNFASPGGADADRRRL